VLAIGSVPVVAAVIMVVGAMIATDIVMVMVLGSPPAVLRRRTHAVRRYIARPPPSGLARPWRRYMPALARAPLEGFPSCVLRIPGAPDIPTMPIVGGDEGDDRNPERRNANVGQDAVCPW
jgi:hypothetical protein